MVEQLVTRFRALLGGRGDDASGMSRTTMTSVVPGPDPEWDELLAWSRESEDDPEWDER